jgi:hypothetical protein
MKAAKQNKAPAPSRKNTESNRGKHRNSRANLKPPWQKGQSGNPAGRPKGQTFADAICEFLDREYETGLTVRQVIALSLIKKAVRGSVQAAALLMDRVDGKAKQAVDVDLTVSDAEISDAIERELEALAARSQVTAP